MRRAWLMNCNVSAHTVWTCMSANGLEHLSPASLPLHILVLHFFNFHLVQRSKLSQVGEPGNRAVQRLKNINIIIYFFQSFQ